MNINQYITENYDNIKNWLSGITKDGNPGLAEDLVQEVILIFLQHPKAQESIDTGTARFFLVRIALNQWRSSTSPFHYQYRDSFKEFPDDWSNGLEHVEYDPTEDILTEVVIQGLDLMYQQEDTRYEAILIIAYYSMGANYSAVGRKLNMKNTTVRKIVLRGLTKLNKLIFDNINNGTFNSTNIDFSSDWSVDSSSDKQQTISMAAKLLESRYFAAT